MGWQHHERQAVRHLGSQQIQYQWCDGRGNALDVAAAVTPVMSQQSYNQ